MSKRTSRAPKGKSGRIRRALEAKAPKLMENTKKLLCLKGIRCNEAMNWLMHDLASLRKPDVKMFSKKNDVRPFEDPSSLEFFSEKNDASLFLMASHSKKRPNNLVLGRMFDHKLLDMIEIGVGAYTPMSECKGPKRSIGAKASFLFQGEGFDHDPTLKVLKNLLLDMFRGKVIESVALPTLDHVIAVSNIGPQVFFRVYSYDFKRSGTRVPNVELVPHGPNFNFTIRRHQLAASDLAKVARKQPRQLKEKKVKNLTHDELGSTLGRIHMERQDYDELQLRKVKALKIVRRKEREAARAGAGAEADSEGEDSGDGAGAEAADVPSPEAAPAPAPPAKKKRARSPAPAPAPAAQEPSPKIRRSSRLRSVSK